MTCLALKNSCQTGNKIDLFKLYRNLTPLGETNFSNRGDLLGYAEPGTLSICMEKLVRIFHQKQQYDFSSNKMERDERVRFAQS